MARLKPRTQHVLGEAFEGGNPEGVRWEALKPLLTRFGGSVAGAAFPGSPESVLDIRFGDEAKAYEFLKKLDSVAPAALDGVETLGVTAFRVPFLGKYGKTLDAKQIQRTGVAQAARATEKRLRRKLDPKTIHRRLRAKQESVESPRYMLADFLAESDELVEGKKGADAAAGAAAVMAGAATDVLSRVMPVVGDVKHQG